MSRIAFIDVTTTISIGGVQTAVWNLAAALQQRGHEVTIFGGEGAIPVPAQCAGVEVRRYPYRPRERAPRLGGRFQRIVERYSMARHAREDVAGGGFDWAVLTKPFDFFWPRLMPAGVRTRFAYMSGGTSFFAGDRYLAQRIDAWLACSHFNAWQVHARYKRFPTVIYNGVDGTCFRPLPEKREAMRAELGITEGEVVFAFAGRLVGWKGLAIAVKALADPRLSDQPARLLVVGEGPQRGVLQRLAERHGVAERVIFQGAVAHGRIPAIYAAADVGVFPSIADEAFGITIAEAMSCGLPVVASHVGGIPEVVGNEASCGLLAPIGDVGALAGQMAMLAADPVLRSQMGRRARARIEAHFTWSASAGRLLAALGL